MGREPRPESGDSYSRALARTQLVTEALAGRGEISAAAAVAPNRLTRSVSAPMRAPEGPPKNPPFKGLELGIGTSSRLAESPTSMYSNDEPRELGGSHQQQRQQHGLDFGIGGGIPRSRTANFSLPGPGGAIRPSGIVLQQARLRQAPRRFPVYPETVQEQATVQGERGGEEMEGRGGIPVVSRMDGWSDEIRESVGSEGGVVGGGETGGLGVERGEVTQGGRGVINTRASSEFFSEGREEEDIEEQERDQGEPARGNEGS